MEEIFLTMYVLMTLTKSTNYKQETGKNLTSKYQREFIFQTTTSTYNIKKTDKIIAYIS